MNSPIVYSSEFFVFDYDVYDEHSQVMALNQETSAWELADLVHVQCDNRYEKFFFIDDLPMPEPKTPVQKAKKAVNELISWVEKWSIHSTAVTEKLNEFRDEIFQNLDEVSM